MILQSNEKDFSFRDVEDALISEGLISYDSISSKTIERKLNEMCNSLGVLNYKTLKRTKYYSISNDIMKNLNDKELKELLITISLYKNVLFPTTAGYYCELTLKDYIKYERGASVQLKDYFQYRNLPFHPIIEEQILWQILNAIHQKRLIELEYKINEYNKKSEPKHFLRPYKIRYDVNCGRFYLVAFNDKDKCIISRLDRIQSVNTSYDTYEIDNLKGLYEIYMKHSWSAVPANDEKELEFLQFEIIFDEPNENYIIEKMKSEVQFGCFERIEKGWYHLTMYVNNSLEMLPWIRSYMGYINVIDGRRLKKKFLNDLKEMIENYGTL
jgi:predicted DNA-binding transcriptional regulator YafY